MFLVRFWAFLGKESSKTPRKKSEFLFYSSCQCPLAFLGVSQRWESKDTGCSEQPAAVCKKFVSVSGAFDMDSFQNVFNGIFELPLLRKNEVGST
jgi:hypothetical protein